MVLARIALAGQYEACDRHREAAVVEEILRVSPDLTAELAAGPSPTIGQSLSSSLALISRRSLICRPVSSPTTRYTPFHARESCGSSRNKAKCD